MKRRRRSSASRSRSSCTRRSSIPAWPRSTSRTSRSAGSWPPTTGVDLSITLLDGKCFEKILTFARKEQPWLLILGPGRRALRRERGRSRLQHREPPAAGAVQRAAHRRQVLPAARRQGRGDHLVDGGGRGADGARAAAGQGRRPHRAPALRHRAGPHGRHQQGHRRGHGHLHADAHGREDADPGRGPRGRAAPRRVPGGDRHLLGLRLHGEGPQSRRDVPGVPAPAPTSSRRSRGRWSRPSRPRRAASRRRSRCRACR